MTNQETRGRYEAWKRLALFYPVVPACDMSVICQRGVGMGEGQKGKLAIRTSGVETVSH